MSLNILKKQVKYCFLSVEDDELNMLRKKQKRENKIKKSSKQDKTEKNLRYFELQEKYKSVSKNVLKYLKGDNKR